MTSSTDAHFLLLGVLSFGWSLVIPVTEHYLRKYNFISAINAFKKLKDDKHAQLLDIRDKTGMVALGSPNLKILNKNVVQVQFSVEDEDEFVKNVLENFSDPANTSLHFGQAIHEKLLPPSVHMKKKKTKISLLGTNGGVGQLSEGTNENFSSVALSKSESQRVDSKLVNKSRISTPHVKTDCRSPYPNCPDLKPPSSPTPSKP